MGNPGGKDKIAGNVNIGDKVLRLIPGKKIAKQKEEWLKEKLLSLPTAPKLRIIQVGDDPASTLYVNMKVSTAKTLGIDMEARVYKTGIDINEVIAGLNEFNFDESVHGVMVQAPVQGVNLHDSLQIFNAIHPSKDVDGLSFASLGKLWQLKSLVELEQANLFISATPLGVLDCLLWLQQELSPSNVNLADLSYGRFRDLSQLLSGKNVLIINRSNIVGKPLAALLEMANATVTLAHSHTKNLTALIAAADIILPATGKDHMFNWEEIGQRKIVIDIGINNNNPEGAVKGDVDFTSANLTEGKSESYLAPVPGGVGPLTVINLLYNTYLSYSRANGLAR